MKKWQICLGSIVGGLIASLAGFNYLHKQPKVARFEDRTVVTECRSNYFDKFHVRRRYTLFKDGGSKFESCIDEHRTIVIEDLDGNGLPDGQSFIYYYGTRVRLDPLEGFKEQFNEILEDKLRKNRKRYEKYLE